MHYGKFSLLVAALVLTPVSVASADDPADWMELWGKPEIEEGTVTMERDDGVWATGPASMLLDMSAEPTKGSLTRGLAATTGEDLTASLKLKLGEGMRPASAGITFVGEGGGHHSVVAVTEPGGWQMGGQTLTVPAGVGMVFLSVSFEGQRQLWIDNLQLEGVLDAGAEGKLGPKNKAGRLRLLPNDVNNTKRPFPFDLTQASATDFTTLLPVDGRAVSPAAANEADQAFDPARVMGHHLQGAWTDEAVDVLIVEVGFAQPRADLLAKPEAAVAQARRKLEQQEERERQEAERREQRLTDGAAHPEDGPEVQYVAPVSPYLLALTIQERWITPGGQIPYEAQDGDEIRTDEKGDKRLSWHKGAPALVGTRTVWRDRNGDGRKERLGTLVNGGATVRFDAQIHGTPITRATLGEPRAYRLRSTNHDAYGEPQNPEAVFIKSKPLERADNGQSPVRHIVYLKLAQPLKPGADYTVSPWGVKARQATVSYRHRPREVRSEAVHASHIGYRPDDPFKRAYLSTWLGTGGALSYDAEQFDLLHAETGESVYKGDAELAIAADEAEMLSPEANHTRTNVYYLNFHDFSTPGRYRLFVPGVGVSYPFEIGQDVWKQAFRTSMHGLLCHRSGIELGPPATDYVRPRPFHPDDGAKLLPLDITMLDGESGAVDKALKPLLGPDLSGPLPEHHPDAWGGYMDAGDWDRRSQHLRLSYLQLELYEMFPDYFRQVELALPADEADNALPDILDEARWNIDFYRRLQELDGGVGGGVESTAHPAPGETSWQESQLVGVFAPDPVTSFCYAAAAAKMSSVLSTLDADLATTYRTTAQAAWNWAETNGERVIEEVRGRGGRVKGSAADLVSSERTLAAVELYRLTRDEAYHTAFEGCSALVQGGDRGQQLDAVFAYANLPDDLGEAEPKQKALDWLIAQGEQALTISSRSSFNIAPRVQQLPMIRFVGYFTTPETTIGPLLPRLHYLTGDEKWLRGALAATQYTAGANPVNATMTTGLGHDYPRAPLHVDSRSQGLEAPRGITIYGPHDPTRIPGWVKTWVVGPCMTPPGEEWPASEFHIDVSGWPEMSEYTVHQSLGPTGYCWGYLAARGR